MDDNRVIVVVVILGIVAIVMMGLVAKIALLETQVANEPGQMDNLRQKRRPPIVASSPPPTSLRYEGSGVGSDKPDNPARGETRSPAPETEPAAKADVLPTAAARHLPAPRMDVIEKEVEKSLLRLSVVDHRQEQMGVAAVVGEGGLLLTSAPFLAGAYEAWVTLPDSKSRTPPFNRCLDWSPEVNLALVRADDSKEPLSPIRLAEALPENGEKVLVFYESGQLALGRTEAAVQGLLSTSDVAKKLDRDMSRFGDAVWIEALGSFPTNIEGAPLVNNRGELAGVALLDMETPAMTGKTVFGAGGMGGAAFRPRNTIRRIYAVSHRGLRRLVERGDGSSADQLIYTLPASPLQKANSAAPGDWSVKMPSGETLTAKTFEPIDHIGGVGTLTYPAGSRCAAVALSDRKELNGPLTIYDKQGSAILRWNFLHGRRDGAMAAYASNGACVLAAQFQRNDRHGYCAYFKEGAPWLVQEYQDGKLGEQHLVKQGAVFHTIAPGKTLDTVETVLKQYGEWSEWDARLTAVAVALGRWAREWERTQRLARSRRPDLDSLNDAQKSAVAAIEDFRNLVH
ncbi:MAG: serine protease [Planctomycetes bacterium]|nr:serine protease [Planctomycetota bacterium]